MGETELSTEELDRTLREYDEALAKGLDGDTEAETKAKKLREEVLEPVAIKASRRLVR